MNVPLRRRRMVLAFAAALSLAIFGLPLAFDVPLLDPDEGLHASIAREMVERGEYVTPAFLGEAFLDKPILFFWAQALSLGLLGYSEQAVRVPGLLFGWLGALTTGLVAARLLGARGGVLAGVAYATLFFPVALAQAAVHDIALVPCVNLAVLALLPLASEAEPPRWVRAAIVAGLWLGLSVLTKGLAGLVFAGLAIAPVLVVRRGPRPWLVSAGLLAVGIAALVAAPWYLAMEAAHPGYLHYYFLERHVEGYAGGTARHGGAPWWYYGPVLLAGGLPWMVFVPEAIRVAVRRPTPSQATNTAVVLATSWLVGGVAFVSLGSAKLSTYLLPAFPAVALLGSVAWLPYIDREPPPQTGGSWVRVGTWIACVTSAVAVVAAAFAMPWYGVTLGASHWALVGAVGATWLLPALAWERGWWQVSFAALAACTAVTLLAGLGGLVPALASRFTARDLAWHYNRAGDLPAHLLFVDERVGSFPFYLSPPLRSRLSPERVRRITPSEAFTMRTAPRDTAFILTDDRAASLATFVDWTTTPSERAGHHVIVPAEALISALKAGRSGGPAVR